MEQLDNAVTFTQRALDLLSETSDPNDNYCKDYANNLTSRLGSMLFDRYERLGEVKDLTDAISLTSEVIKTARQPERSALSSSLSDMLHRQYELEGNREYLDRAVKTARQAIISTLVSDPDLPRRRSNLSVILMSVYRLTGHDQTLEEAISYAKTALESTTQDQPQYVGFLNNLMILSLSCVKDKEDLRDMNKTISLAREVIRSKPKGNLDPTIINTLGGVLLEIYARTRNMEALDEAISYTRKSIEASNPADVAARRATLSNMLLKAYEHKTEKAYLEEAMSQAHMAVEMTPLGHRDLPSRLGNLGNILIRQYEQTGDVQYLEQAVSNAKMAVDLTLEHHSDLAQRINSRSNISPEQEHPHDVGGAQDPASKEPKSSAMAIKFHPEAANLLNNFGNMLLKKYSRFGEAPVLDEAIEKTSAALTLVPPDSATYIQILHNLGGMWFSQFDRTGKRGYLEKSIAAATKTVKSAPGNHPELPGRLSSLSNMLYRRYELGKKIEDLNSSVEMSEAAIRSPIWNRADQLKLLSIVLAERAEQMNRPADLDRAISMAEDSVRHTAEDSPSLSSRLGHLGYVLWKRYQERERDSDRDEGIAQTRKAIEVSPCRADCAPNGELITQLANLSSMLQLRYNKMKDERDLEEAISRARDTVGEIKKNRPRFSTHPGGPGNSLLQRMGAMLKGLVRRIVSEDLAIPCSNLSDMLLQKYKKTNDSNDLYEAIGWAREAVRATLNGDAGEAERLRTLKNLLSMRHEITLDETDLYEIEDLTSQLGDLGGDDDVRHSPSAPGSG
ncbi:hypothetical protein F5Y14DRAFT_426173 [Nemania sp. NC0429]|nr:hypothetical protein F5Y14DRAFT_426173 [Nemania sp. NC0429]